MRVPRSARRAAGLGPTVRSPFPRPSGRRSGTSLFCGPHAHERAKPWIAFLPYRAILTAFAPRRRRSAQEGSPACLERRTPIFRAQAVCHCPRFERHTCFEPCILIRARSECASRRAFLPGLSQLSAPPFRCHVLPSNQTVAILAQETRARGASEGIESVALPLQPEAAFSLRSAQRCIGSAITAIALLASSPAPRRRLRSSVITVEK